MNPDYSPKPYYTVRRKLIDETLNQLHETQLDMIDQAVEYSDLQQARDVIAWIKDKQ